MKKKILHQFTTDHKHNTLHTQTTHTSQFLIWSINLFLMFEKLLIVKWLYCWCRGSCGITTNW